MRRITHSYCIRFLRRLFWTEGEPIYPWLQELPDQLTSVVYGSWAELNPETAEEMGIDEGDILEIESASGSVRVPALLFPAIRPGVVAMPIGQGHASFGRYAENRGVNPIDLVAARMDEQSGDLAWGRDTCQSQKYRRANANGHDGWQVPHTRDVRFSDRRRSTGEHIR